MKRLISAFLAAVLAGKCAVVQAAPYSYLNDYDNTKVCYGVGNDVD